MLCGRVFSYDEGMAAPTNHSRVLHWLTLLVWVAWLLSIALMAHHYVRRAAHPSSLTLLGALLILAIAFLSLAAAVSLRMVRGPDRTAAAGWLMIAATPLLLAASHFSYSVWVFIQQHSAPDIPSKLASAAFASAADVVARYRHPIRSKGKFIELLRDAQEDQSDDLTPYETHIVHLEETLGHQPGNTVRLARGPIFGHPEEGLGWYLCGLAINQRAQGDIDDIDRHELAHVIIDLHCGLQAHPPTVLVEGWAESQSGYPEGYLAKRAWKRRVDGSRISLRAMTSDGWYAASNWHCYEFGGALVDYILRTHGGTKFFELYSTCQPDTFEDDVSRILGVTVEELDRRYWDDIGKQVAELPVDLENTLSQLPLADGIDPSEWKAFAAEFAQALNKPSALSH